ncbi:N-hydroxyarylamine O-acetyltransferase [Silvimonas terrae]|uniref:N-hydroxyarylamine O-acetyltransferase n=1 Tax=Silvimonas terrae TaxID=300266 RepID=A0A840RLM0_9NEIS|nr:arylamine N-acetyltransferase [Silvimonas terrae]MBB5193092.1 N-hydroxyarylamine O-acetyltransferase [Silvimonas terrae]
MTFVERYLQYLELKSLPDDPLTRLRALHVANQQRIPFNNVDVLLGRPPQLDPDEVADKVLTRGRGGYCFELNGLFARLLRELGYEVHVHLGKMLAGGAIVEERPRTHMVLSVQIDGQRWICDVSFGARGLTDAAPLIEDTPIAQLDTLRYHRHGDGFLMQTRRHEHWETLYWFDLQDTWMADWIMSNHYSSTFPASPFLHNLMALRLTGHGRITFNNLRMAELRDGMRSETLISTPQQLYTLINQHLLLPLNQADAGALFTRLATQPAINLV